MTFKILYNDAVAMTGGQPVEQAISPIDMVTQLLAEGVRPVYLVSDDPGKYRGQRLPDNASLYHRDELDRLQRELRQTRGVSGIVYEQTCATELRRRRKRALAPEPDQRLFINPEVCEGCGDCSVQSNCISIAPLETEFGRKRQIDQSTCNKDYSCAKGFCPSFVTVTGASIAARASAEADQVDALLAQLPPPAATAPTDGVYNILIGGVGGTGVLTLGALLGMAAHLDGRAATVLDMTGMAQKGGAVTSHVRLGDTPQSIHSTRLAEGMCDLLLGCDMIVGASQPVLCTFAPGRTTAVLNTDVAPTGDFQSNKHLDLDAARLRRAIDDALDGGTAYSLGASALARDLTGDSIGTNILLLGYAVQRGLIPLTLESIEQAIRLNGSFVEGNLRTLALGRLAAHDAEALAALLGPPPAPVALDTVEEVLDSRGRLLRRYQDAHYADQYQQYIASVRERVAARGLENGDRFVREVALTLARLMAYKDEYEVARLYTDGNFTARLREQFDGDYSVSFNLAPPLLPGTDAATGRPKKRAFGPWMFKALGVLARFKRLRGTPFDPFGYTAERRLERQLITDYRALIDTTIEQLTAANLDAGIAVAAAARDIAGYGPVKLESVAAYRAALPALLARLERPGDIAVRLVDQPAAISSTAI
jgi:indolepyruvate ferredoxin oxidoreductase